MPHTGNILPGGRYAVVSCHVERPLDDETWSRFSTLQERRPGGFRIAALMRPPDPGAGEDEDRWMVRARAASERGPLGLHTHWTAPGHARPTAGVDPAGRVREQLEWLRARGLEVRLFCGGGWYIDEHVAQVLAELGLADCTATAFRPGYLEPGAMRIGASEPCFVELPSGGRILELPTTHSLGVLLRGLARPFGVPLVHAYFHDTDLIDWRRRAALSLALRVLAIRRTPTDLGELQRGLRAEKTMSFANSRG
jgi:hypothetical protein